MQTECLVRVPASSPVLEACVRFLQPMAREIGTLPDPGQALADTPAFQGVRELRVDGHVFQSWQEAVEREIKLPPVPLSGPFPRRLDFPFSYPASQTLEPILDQRGRSAGMLRRRQEMVAGLIGK